MLSLGRAEGRRTRQLAHQMDLSQPPPHRRAPARRHAMEKENRRTGPARRANLRLHGRGAVQAPVLAHDQAVVLLERRAARARPAGVALVARVAHLARSARRAPERAAAVPVVVTREDRPQHKRTGSQLFARPAAEKVRGLCLLLQAGAASPPSGNRGADRKFALGSRACREHEPRTCACQCASSYPRAACRGHTGAAAACAGAPGQSPRSCCTSRLGCPPLQRTRTPWSPSLRAVPRDRPQQRAARPSTSSYQSGRKFLFSSLRCTQLVAQLPVARALLTDTCHRVDTAAQGAEGWKHLHGSFQQSRSRSRSAR